MKCIRALRSRWVSVAAATLGVSVVPILELARLPLTAITVVQLFAAAFFLANAAPQWWREGLVVTALAVLDAARIASQRPRNVLTGILITAFSAHITEYVVAYALRLVSPGAEAIRLPSAAARGWKLEWLKLYLQGRDRGSARGSPPLLANGVASLYLEAAAVVFALAVALVTLVLFLSEGLLQAPSGANAAFRSSETADVALHSGLALVTALASVCSSASGTVSGRCRSALDAAVEACRNHIEENSGLRLTSVSYKPAATDYDWSWSSGAAGELSSDTLSYTVGLVEAKAVWVPAGTMFTKSAEAPACWGAVEGLAAALLCIGALTLASLSSTRSVQRGIGAPVMSLLGLIDDYDATLVRNAWTALLHERSHPQHPRHHDQNAAGGRLKAFSTAVMGFSSPHEGGRLYSPGSVQQHHGGGDDGGYFPAQPQASPNPIVRMVSAVSRFVQLLLYRCWCMVAPLWLRQLIVADAELLWKHRNESTYRRGASPAVGAHHAVIYRQAQGTVVHARSGGGGGAHAMAVAESEALEAVVARLVALQRMKQEHHDVRHSTHIERGQFVDPKVSDWINTTFMHGYSQLLLEEGGVSRAAQDVELKKIAAVDDSALIELLSKLRKRDKELDKVRRRQARMSISSRRSSLHPFMEGGPGSSSSSGGRQAQHKSSRVHPTPSASAAEGQHTDHHKQQRRRLRKKRSWSAPPLGRAPRYGRGNAVRDDGSGGHRDQGGDQLTLVSPVFEGEGSVAGGGDTEEWEETFGGARAAVFGRRASTPPIVRPTDTRLLIAALSPHPIDSVKFDMLQISTLPDLAHAVRSIFEASGLVDRFEVSQGVLGSFVEQVVDGYLPQAPESAGGGPRYHNAFHGADVLHTVWRFQLLIGAEHLFGPAERFGQLIAAFGHDLGHPGLNNPYLINSQHAAARLFHDDSPLENMHCAELFRVLNGRPRGKVLQGLHAQHAAQASGAALPAAGKKNGVNGGLLKDGSNGGGGGRRSEECDVFARMSAAEKASVRRVVVKCILSTDMAYHFQQVNELNALLNGKVLHSRAYYRALGDLPRHGRFGESPSPALSFLKDYKTRVQVLEFLVHLADISNPLKPNHIYMAWTDRIVEEFCSQGDRERAEGTPISPMCDRESLNLVNMQLGFLDFVVAPFASKVIALFPPLVTHGLYLHGNYSNFALRKLGGDVQAAKSHAGRKRLGQTIFDAAHPVVSAPSLASWAAPPSVWSAAVDSRGSVPRAVATSTSNAPLVPSSTKGQGSNKA